MQDDAEMEGKSMEEKIKDLHTERIAAVLEESTGSVSSFSKIIGLHVSRSSRCIFSVHDYKVDEGWLKA